MSVAVEPEKILRDLHNLWEQLGHDQEASGGVLRACAMTLIVVAEDQNDAEQENARQKGNRRGQDRP